MDTFLIELRMAVRSLPTDSRDVQLAIKAEVLRLAELLEQRNARELLREWLDHATEGNVSLVCEKCDELKERARELLKG